MSNHHAIATVTAVVSQILADVIKDVPGTVVTSKPPDVIGSEPASNRLNLFLYQITPNIGYKNSDMPARNRDGELIKKPQLALDLCYLLTAYATDNDDLQAQQILASAMRILHENPVLTRERIRETIKNESKIADSDLAYQVELIKLSPKPLSLDEVTKLWSSFFQTHYRISVAYEATVVLLESKQEPRLALPVRKSLLSVYPFKQPVIEKVEPQILERAPNAKLTIIGQNLKAETVKVQFGRLEPREPKKPDDIITDNQIILTVPDELTAGIKSVQVLHQLMLGSPEIEHRGYESNVVAFVLAPRIISAGPIPVLPSGNLTLEFEPAVTSGQKVTVLIGDYTFSVPPRDPESEPLKKLTITIPDNFPTGTYLLRLRVDGAESFLEVDKDKNSLTYEKLTGPKITVSSS